MIIALYFVAMGLAVWKITGLPQEGAVIGMVGCILLCLATCMDFRNFALQREEAQGATTPPVMNL